MTLRDEIERGETHDMEFKRQANDDRSKFLKTAVAFANGKGGRILFGVNNDRTVCGISRSEIFTEMDAIVNSVSDGCAPRVPVDIGIENFDGKSVIVLEVLAGSRCPYYLKSEGPEDGVYVRVGATTRQADDATRRELAYLSEGRSYDGEPCLRAKIDDKRIAALCSRMYRIARRNCTTEAKKRAVKRITADQLESWGVISKVRDHWVASNAYALLTGDGAFAIRLKCGVFKGDTKAVFVDRREFTGSVMDLIEEGFDYILAKINMGCVFKGVYRQDVYEIPPDELRELVINAFAHRNYIEHDAPIFIAVYDTRVEITSPGGLPRGQTAERALAGYSKIRNTVLAKTLNYMNFIEEWGSGLLRVNQAFRDSGLQDLEIEDVGFATRMNVYRSSATVNEGLKPKTGALNGSDVRVNVRVSKGAKPNAGALNGGGVTVNDVQNANDGALKDDGAIVDAVVNDTVNVRAKGDEKLLLLIESCPGKKASDYALQLGKTTRTVMRYLAVLGDKVEFRGAPKTGGYYLREQSGE